MKQLFFAVAAFAALLAGPVVAADLPVKAPVYRAPPAAIAYNWSGFYFGAYAGGHWSHVDATHADTLANLPTDLSGAVFGGLVGYNHQINQIVIGVEGEFGGSTAKKTVPGVTIDSQTVENRWIGRVRGRFGVLFGNAMLFGAGGYSVADYEVTLLLLVVPPVETSIRSTHHGWNIGGGLDYAFTPNWIGRIEYIYDRFESKTYGFLAASGNTFGNRIVEPDSSTVRAAITYKFGGPVVARY
jgi:outer membrane immunogenic protein